MSQLTVQEFVDEILTEIEERLEGTLLTGSRRGFESTLRSEVERLENEEER